MRHYDKFQIFLRNLIYHLCDYLIYILVFSIFIAIILTLLTLPNQLKIVLDFNSETLIHFLQYAMNILIAIEIIHVVCKPSLDTVVEVLIIAITREIIINHFSMFEILLAVLSLAILFLIRKYLFIKQIDQEDINTASH